MYSQLMPTWSSILRFNWFFACNETCLVLLFIVLAKMKFILIFVLLCSCGIGNDSDNTSKVGRYVPFGDKIIDTESGTVYDFYYGTYYFPDGKSSYCLLGMTETRINGKFVNFKIKYKNQSDIDKNVDNK